MELLQPSAATVTEVPINFRLPLASAAAGSHQQSSEARLETAWTQDVQLHVGSAGVHAACQPQLNQAQNVMSGDGTAAAMHAALNAIAQGVALLVCEQHTMLAGMQLHTTSRLVLVCLLPA